MEGGTRLYKAIQERMERQIVETSCCLVIIKSCQTLVTPCSLPGFSVHGFPRQEYSSGLLFLSLGDLPDPEIVFTSLASSASVGRFFTTWEVQTYVHSSIR